MTETKPNLGHDEHRYPVDATSQPERANDGGDIGNAPEADNGAPQEKAKRAAIETGGDDREAGKETDDEEVDDEEQEDEDEDEDENEDDEDDEEEEDDDDEPRLKYARLTQHLGAVYRNGDSTSAFLVAGDKMIVGTHKGNIVMNP